MELYAIANPGNTHFKRLEVYDLDGLAHIIKTFPTGRVKAWTSPDRSPREWVELNSGSRQKWEWSLA